MVVIAVEARPGKGQIQVEVDGVAAPDELVEIYQGIQTRESVAEKVTRISRPLFTEALDLMQLCAEAMADRLDAMQTITPDEVEMQLAIKLDASVGAKLVAMTAGAQMQVTLRWSKRA